MKGDADDIGLIRPIDGLGLFIDVSYLPIRGNSSGQIRHGYLLEIQEARPPRSSNFIRGCRNEEKFRQSALTPNMLSIASGRGHMEKHMFEVAGLVEAGQVLRVGGDLVV